MPKSPTHAATRATPRASRLALLVVLLFGIVAMHSLGHPREHGAGAERGTGGHVAGAPGGGHVTGARVDGYAVTAPVYAGAGGTQPHSGAVAAPRSPAPHDPGTDPLSVCLAVLGAALTLALLHAAVRHRPGGALVPGHRLARLLDALRPNPPPPRDLLTRLSVLRV
ncbi:hypothetical protein GPA10_04150 [Streptomyces sp. p1417]|uniref:Uncharacterized protein n=1 Tax=Streptomyces typhae TaxID=2681492 RepID=A0A6L6WQW0_9ACTN|nr:hypothetical protein [Streptomyces typhae]